jgi:diketogulonate reductase-like aldo/keto reductase
MPTPYGMEIQLKSGHLMPLLGLGTWDLHGDACISAVTAALKIGYRHVDTAYYYRNHRDIAEGISNSRIRREELFITTKIWRDSLRYEEVHRQFSQCLSELRLDYVDLLLIHHPNPQVPLAETCRAFDEIVSSGEARSIGVSNFSNELLRDAQQHVQAPISNNQVQLHAGQQNPLHGYPNNNVSLTAYRPLARGQLTSDVKLLTIGDKYQKTASQVALRWLTQQNIAAIPKAQSTDHLIENSNIFSWVLSDRDFAAISNGQPQ